MRKFAEGGGQGWLPFVSSEKLNVNSEPNNVVKLLHVQNVQGVGTRVDIPYIHFSVGGDNKQKPFSRAIPDTRGLQMYM